MIRPLKSAPGMRRRRRKKLSGSTKPRQQKSLERSRPPARDESSSSSLSKESDSSSGRSRPVRKERLHVPEEPQRQGRTTRRRSRPLTPERPHGPGEPQRRVTLVPFRAAQGGLVQLGPVLSDVNSTPLGKAMWQRKEPEPVEQVGPTLIAMTPQWGAAAAEAGTTAIPAAKEARKLKRKSRHGDGREKVRLAPSCGSDGRCRFEVARKGKRSFRQMYLSRSL